jgi:hypothetical protein
VNAIFAVVEMLASRITSLLKSSTSITMVPPVLKVRDATEEAIAPPPALATVVVTVAVAIIYILLNRCAERL